MTYHMFVCPKFILRPFLRSHYVSGGIRFGKCCTFVLKSVGIDILAASGGLYAILGGYYYSIPLEHGRNGFSNSKKDEHGRNGFINSKPPKWISHHQKIILRSFLRLHLASGGLRFEKCRTLVLKSESTWELWIISEEMKLNMSEIDTATLKKKRNDISHVCMS